MDRLALIRARHEEAGGGNGDFEWLIAEVEKLRKQVRRIIHEIGIIVDKTEVP